MKKFLAIFVLSVYLFSTTELSELLKIPILVEHFLEHKKWCPDLTFKDFLAIHYDRRHLEGHPDNDDYKKDMSLPFINHSESLSFHVVIPKTLHFFEKDFPNDGQVKARIRNDRFCEDDFISVIWQPPRFC